MCACVVVVRKKEKKRVKKRSVSFKFQSLATTVGQVGQSVGFVCT